MSDYEYLPASDGTGDAALMHIQADRLSGDATILVDSVSKVSNKFIATYGTLGSNGLITPETKRDFKGHVSGSTLVIDAFAPGNADAGNTEGQVVIIKPNSYWSNLVAQFIKNATGFGTPDNLTANSLSASGLISGANGLELTSGTFSVPAGAVTRPALEKLHYNALLFATNGGTVFHNEQVTVPFNASDTTNAVGITADLTQHTLTIARDGFYSAQFRYTCIDVAATDGFIPWIYFNVPGVGQYYFRKSTQGVAVGESSSLEVRDIFLPAGTIIHAEQYRNSSGNTRFGTANDGGTDPFINRLLKQSLTVRESR